MNTDYTELEVIAFNLARNAHGSQPRRGTTRSYWSAHVEDVYERARRVRTKTDEEAYKLRIVALLHDTVEDTEITLESLAQTFPKAIVDAVDAITKRQDELYPDYIARVIKNKFARGVKFLDILSNLNSDPTPNQMAKYGYALIELSKVQKSA